MGALDDFLISEGLVKTPSLPSTTFNANEFSFPSEAFTREQLNKSTFLYPTGTYNLGSPEIANFFGVKKISTQPDLKMYDRLSGSTDSSSNPFIDIEGWNPSKEYVNKILAQGGSIQDLSALGKYQNFFSNWKENQGVERINKLTQIAQNNPDPIYSFSTKESPLYRGALNKTNISPVVGEKFSFGENRFQSFSPDLGTAADFMQGKAPYRDEKGGPSNIITSQGKPTLFQIEKEPTSKYNYFITPGPDEQEVLSRPDARYQVTAKESFPDFAIRGAKPFELDVVKLRQIYGVDPIGAAAQGAKELVGSNLAGSFAGAATAALDPEVAQQIAQNKYGEAAATTAKNIGLGALAEEGIKRAAPLAGRYAPALLNTASQVVAPVVTGAALFAQGQPGSLTDVLTHKAAQHPVSWLPSVQANPQTDIGARASRAIGNEARYAFQKLLQGKIPYMGK